MYSLSRDAVKASTVDEDGFCPLCSFSMLLHHLAAPGRLASQVEAVHAVLCTCLDELASVKMVGSSKGNDTSRLLDHLSQSGIVVLAMNNISVLAMQVLSYSQPYRICDQAFPCPSKLAGSPPPECRQDSHRDFRSSKFLQNRLDLAL